MANMEEKYVPRLKVKYQGEIAPALMKKFNYTSTMQIPRLEKIVVNVDGLTDGSKVFAKDVVLPEGVVLDVEDPEESVVTVEVPEDAAPVEAAPAADAAAAPAADAE